MLLDKVSVTVQFLKCHCEMTKPNLRYSFCILIVLIARKVHSTEKTVFCVIRCKMLLYSYIHISIYDDSWSCDLTVCNSMFLTKVIFSNTTK